MTAAKGSPHTPFRPKFSKNLAMCIFEGAFIFIFLQTEANSSNFPSQEISLSRHTLLISQGKYTTISIFLEIFTTSTKLIEVQDLNLYHSAGTYLRSYHY